MAAPTIKLLQAIDTPERDGVTDLVFQRRMNGGDLAAAGFGINLSEDTEITLSAEQVNLIASRCTGLPKSVIEALEAPDWLQVFKTVMSFFQATPI